MHFTLFMKHIPVLVKEVLDYLDPKPGNNIIDCTLGLGGHSRAILEETKPDGKILAIEQNLEGIGEAKKNLQKYKKHITYINDNFVNLSTIVRSCNFNRISGILLDLGLASWQITDSSLGITFTKNESLDMRLGDRNSEIGSRKYQTAEYIINRYSVKELADIFYKYGDMRNSWSLARKIEIARRREKIKTTFDFVNAVGSRNPKILAPIFQTLRIIVNNELVNLEKVLFQSIDLLQEGGRLVVISYHSGEDRIVKNFLRDNKNCFNVLTKKPIIPSQQEIKNNPRARSAKLRAGEKIK